MTQYNATTCKGRDAALRVHVAKGKPIAFDARAHMGGLPTRGPTT
jgi:hypothetical protein